ncbi:DUF4268 domain-containing protein [Halorussus limi]|uniref:DUF4268 domain-containing protein n=1 Tax=Halorussus limi TaxID=2938695 RepID=A0A8U0HPP8_9EURY|nr:DUF4268 domain-containing protein [Halorussus limi]UPV72723.1 DUF4268 domain-containing protein [Halorussus limi]
MSSFASLTSQDVRDYWEHEEREFTPWLAEEIVAEDSSELENVLGLDLEVIEREKSVGKYNVDIFARVIDDGRNVVIENQLNDSDHDHLGKAIAYAAGVDADIIVWVAPRFNDEHRDAVQWVNENSREGVDLFAIRLEVWRIEDSPPAVRLNPVEKPSEWKEKAKRREGELSETKQLQEEFWTEFRNRIQASSSPLRARKPKPRHYYSNPIGKSGYHISFGIYWKEQDLRLELIIKDNEEAFQGLKSEKEAIESELRTDVEWVEPRETRGGNMRSNIRVAREADIENREQWDEYFDWMLEYGKRFHDVFPERLRQID